MQDKKTWLTVSILKFVPDRPMRVHCTVFNDAFPSPKLSETIKITFKDFVEATVHKFSQHDQLELACEPPGQVGTLSYIGDSALSAIFSKTLTGKAIDLDVSFHAQLSLFKQL